MPPVPALDGPSLARAGRAVRAPPILAAVVLAAALPGLAAGSRASPAEGKEIFSSSFGGALGAPWRTIGGTWTVEGGVLRQTDAGGDDPTKAILVLPDAESASSEVVLAARLRIDAWADSEWARTGIGLCADPSTGHGLNLLFHRGELRFMQDYVAWGPGCPFRYETGAWYRMKLLKVPGEMRGKAWRDGDPEPDWMTTWREHDESLVGYPALVGPSSDPAGAISAVSFAECRLTAAAGGPSAYYARKATWEESMAASLEAIAREEAEIEAPRERWGPWYLIGPFQGSGGRRAFAEAFPPETEVDIEAPSGDLRWTAHPEWTDGIVHYDLPTGDDIAVYLHRLVAVETPRTITAWFGSDDGMAVWLNGKPVLSRDVARSAAPNQDRASLDLVRGRNSLLVKIHDHTGPSGFYFSPSSVPGAAGDPRREGLWRLLARDFPDARSRREMAWEREDGIWAHDGIAAPPEALAERYLAATRRGLADRAPGAGSAETVERARRLYRRSREIDAALAAWDEARVVSLRLAIEDLAATFGERYPRGEEYRRRLARIEETIALGRGAADPAGGETFLRAAGEFEELRSEALLANPLLDFDRLLLVKRRDSRELKPRPRLEGEAGLFVGNDLLGFLNGLPINFQGNGYLRHVPFENEIAVLSPVRPDGRLTTLHRPEKRVYVGDLDLDFDGERLLFSSIGSHDRWQIFEIGADGRGLRQVTRGDEEDVDSYDACYLPDGRVLHASSSCFQSVPCERRCDEVANFCVVDRDGSSFRRLCFDQDHDFYPAVLADGRILYTRWEYTDIAHAFTGRLMTMNPDGTMQRAHYASGSFWPNRIFWARPVPEHPTKFVGIVSGHHGTARAGELVLFDVALGRRQAEGAVQRIPGRGRTVEAKMVDNLVDGSWPKSLHPHPLSDNYFLVSSQPTSGARWGIWLVDVFDNRLLLREEEGHVLFEPVPLRATRRPPVIPDRTDPSRREATVYLSDIYRGPGLRGVPRGTIRELRLFTYHFNYYGTSGIEDYVGMDGPWDVRRVLGTVPVEEDGSAWFTVPANTPIAIQPLDHEGKAVQLMRSWFTAMPGESVSCVGCHEDSNEAPPPPRARRPLEKPSPIAPWHGPVRGFSWDREVQPVIDRHCVRCHDGGSAADGKAAPDLRRAAPRSMPLSPFPFPPAFYELRRFVRSPGLEGPSVIPVGDYHADTSPLVQMLRKGHGGVRLDEESWDRIVTWIDMNAPAYGTWLEIPTVRDRGMYLRSPPEFFSVAMKPLPVAEIEHWRQRRMALLRRHGIEEDPEAIVPTTFSAAAAAPGPVVPAPPSAAAAPPRADGWPFDPEEASRRQAAAGASRMELEIGDGVRLALSRVPAGSFVMGGREGYDDEKPSAAASIARPFWIGETEVTNEQYRAFDLHHESGVEPMLWLKWHPGHLPALDGARQPVCRVSWDDAIEFCRWLSVRTGKRFRLPDEVEWEWACRAGTAGDWSLPAPAREPTANIADRALLDLGNLAAMEKVRPFFAIDDVMDGHTVSAPAGSFGRNAWGLADLHGNVWEWTASAYRPYPFRSDDPLHARPEGRKAVRGGSWRARADLARSGSRTSYWPWQRVFDVGFRVVCEAE